MRSLITAVVALTLLLPACTKYSSYRPGFAGATGGERLERAFWDSVKDKDWRTLEQHLSATYLAVTPGAVMDRAATLEHLRSIDLADYSIAELRTEPSGSDVVVTYLVTARGTLKGQPIPSTSVRMTTVWQQVKKGWIAVLHTEAPVGP